MLSPAFCASQMCFKTFLKIASIRETPNGASNCCIILSPAYSVSDFRITRHAMGLIDDTGRPQRFHSFCFSTEIIFIQASVEIQPSEKFVAFQQPFILFRAVKSVYQPIERWHFSDMRLIETTSSNSAYNISLITILELQLSCKVNKIRITLLLNRLCTRIIQLITRDFLGAQLSFYCFQEQRRSKNISTYLNVSKPAANYPIGIEPTRVHIYSPIRATLIMCAAGLAVETF